ncbi:NADP-dependent oxidoreductase [Micromonospora sp. NPDC126480]|uniref:NADP-dependent oxidoreductase n=1 Tax=Micromonospora sp. NPDC126480 TaxID=3155312 RepID=UPI003325D2CF
MKAVIVRHFGGPDVLEVAEVPEPRPERAQVRIRVVGAAVNRIDLSTRSGALTAAGLLPPLPSTGLGWDVAGVVDEVGADVSTFVEGDAVIGLRDVLSAPGAQAQWVVLDAAAVAAAPRSIPLVEAAALPLVGLTALESLDLSGVCRGDTLLVTGAAGGIGALVVQLAARRGVRTVAVAGAKDEEAVRGYGADEFISREGLTVLGADVRRIVPGGVDAAIDAAVIGIAAHEALRAGGTFVTLVRPFAPPPLRSTRVVVAESWADGTRLADLVALVDAGQLTPPTARTMPLDRVAEAHETFAAGGVRGRLVLVP